MIVVSDTDFPELILDSTLPVLVEFSAEWCGPCMALAPIIEELEKDWEGKIGVGKLDVDENPVSARRYGVLSIPTLILFRNGRSIERVTGLVNKAEIQRRVKNALTD